MGFRPDRDTGRYYRLLLNDLRAKWDGPLHVATNDPHGFDPGIDLESVNNIAALRRCLWDDDDWQDQYHRRLGWHARNHGIGQYKFPHMIEVYLAKTELMLRAAERFGEIVWLDAGLLFSVFHDHAVPETWAGYDRVRLNEGLGPWLDSFTHDRPVVATIPRKWRPLKNRRPSFHGLTYLDMGDLARRAETRAESFYTVAGAMRLSAADAAVIRREWPNVWGPMLDMGRAGTEETVLSVLTWRHRWHAVPLAEWMTRLAVPPPGWTGP
jgi:hypothetical protein